MDSQEWAWEKGMTWAAAGHMMKPASSVRCFSMNSIERVGASFYVHHLQWSQQHRSQDPA
jgi:hypothetical protein